ncbi:hypothetical protein SAMN05880590_102712 [Rhizobium sp. RU35A]|uniref:hypothetical protein n=1 Tax=Rhizobium sp. RU35A TaxID=1907414 RepID=UPI0009550D7B|nr:hypothetical protein [Rhizobium sp. RU35A]SIQ23364.1 hypothetical protein SAMN05880590_102712 [Rhizobium sp. RU35A]
MTQFLAKAALATLIAASSLMGSLSAASAAEGPVVNVQWRDDGRWDGPRHHRPPPREGCSPWFAQEKASRMGLRRARVVDVNRRVVVVAGFDRGGRDRVVFANVRGCPVIRR